MSKSHTFFSPPSSIILFFCTCSHSFKDPDTWTCCPHCLLTPSLDSFELWPPTHDQCKDTTASMEEGSKECDTIQQSLVKALYKVYNIPKKKLLGYIDFLLIVATAAMVGDSISSLDIGKYDNNQHLS